MTAFIHAPVVVEDFGGAAREFKLTLKTIGTLQTVLQSRVGQDAAGIGSIYRRVMLGQYYIEDITETVRYAMVGGGLSLPDVNALIDTYADYYPLDFWHELAGKVLSASMHIGVDGKSGGEGTGKKQDSPLDGSASPLPEPPPS